MKTYYLTPKFKILYAITPIIIFVFLFKLFSNYYICLGIYGVVVLFITISNIIGEHIVLSENGIQYHRLGLTFIAKWEDIEDIGKNFLLPFIEEGLRIDLNQIRISEWWLGHLTGWSRKAFIHLSCFSDNWRNSELGQQIKEYAPHLFK